MFSSATISAHLADDKLDTAVLLAAFLSAVVADRVGFAEALGRQSALVNTALHQRGHDRGGPGLTQALIGVGIAVIVGVALNGDVSVGSTKQHLGSLVEGRLRLGSNGGRTHIKLNRLQADQLVERRFKGDRRLLDRLFGRSLSDLVADREAGRFEIVKGGAGIVGRRGAEFTGGCHGGAIHGDGVGDFELIVDQRRVPDRGHHLVNQLALRHLVGDNTGKGHAGDTRVVTFIGDQHLARIGRRRRIGFGRSGDGQAVVDIGDAINLGCGSLGGIRFFLAGNLSFEYRGGASESGRGANAGAVDRRLSALKEVIDSYAVITLIVGILGIIRILGGVVSAGSDLWCGKLITDHPGYSNQEHCGEHTEHEEKVVIVVFVEHETRAFGGRRRVGAERQGHASPHEHIGHRAAEPAI